MKIFAMMKKDVSFCSAWVVAGILITVLCPLYLTYALNLHETSTGAAYLLSALFACGAVVSRMCYVEDNYETKKFLSSLPVSYTKIIICRYAENLLLTAVLTGLSAVCCLISGAVIHTGEIAIFISAGLIYEGIYFLLFYRWGSNAAQCAFIVVAAILLVAYVMADRYGIPKIFIGTGYLPAVIFSVIGAGVYILSLAVSCFACRST